MSLPISPFERRSDVVLFARETIRAPPLLMAAMPVID
jgi:hypothetical protein